MSLVDEPNIIRNPGGKFELVTLMLNLVIDYNSNNMKHKVRIKDCVKVWALSKNISVIVLIIYTGGDQVFQAHYLDPLANRHTFAKDG